MNAFKQGAFSNSEAHHRALPIMALGSTASHEAREVVWQLRIGDIGTLEQRAIERWENEGGEIPNEQRRRTSFVKGESIRPSTFYYFSKAIST